MIFKRNTHTNLVVNDQHYFYFVLLFNVCHVIKIGSPASKLNPNSCCGQNFGQTQIHLVQGSNLATNISVLWGTANVKSNTNGWHTSHKHLTSCPLIVGQVVKYLL